VGKGGREPFFLVISGRHGETVSCWSVNGDVSKKGSSRGGKGGQSFGTRFQDDRVKVVKENFLKRNSHLG